MIEELRMENSESKESAHEKVYEVFMQKFKQTVEFNTKSAIEDVKF